MNSINGSGGNDRIDLSIFEGAKDKDRQTKQLGSDGRLKGRNVSTLKQIGKFIQHLSIKRNKAYNAKRAAQISLYDHRIATLAKQPSIASLAKSLDSKPCTVSDKELISQSVDTSLLKTLEQVYTDISREKDETIEKEGHQFVVMSTDGSKARAQLDNTAILRSTINELSTPDGVININNAIHQAKSKEYISEKQVADLQKLLGKNLKAQAGKLYTAFQSKPQGSGNELHNNYLSRVDTIQKMYSALHTINPDLLDKKSSESATNQVIRKDLRDVAKLSVSNSGVLLKPHPSSLFESKARLNASETAHTKLKKLLEYTCSESNFRKHLAHTEADTNTPQYHMKQSLTSIPAMHKKLQDLLNNRIPECRTIVAEKNAELTLLTKETNKTSGKKHDRKTKSLEEIKLVLEKLTSRYNDGVTQLKEKQNTFSDWKAYHTSEGEYPLRRKSPSVNDRLLTFAAPQNTQKDTAFSAVEYAAASALLDSIAKATNNGKGTSVQTQFAADRLQMLVEQHKVLPETALSIIEHAHQYSCSKAITFEKAVIEVSQNNAIPTIELVDIAQSPRFKHSPTHLRASASVQDINTEDQASESDAFQPNQQSGDASGYPDSNEDVEDTPKRRNSTVSVDASTPINSVIETTQPNVSVKPIASPPNQQSGDDSGYPDSNEDVEDTPERGNSTDSVGASSPIKQVIDTTQPDVSIEPIAPPPNQQSGNTSEDPDLKEGVEDTSKNRNSTVSADAPTPINQVQAIDETWPNPPSYIDKAAEYMIRSENPTVPSDAFTQITDVINELFPDGAPNEQLNHIYATLHAMGTILSKPNDEGDYKQFANCLKAFKTSCTHFRDGMRPQNAEIAFKAYLYRVG